MYTLVNYSSIHFQYGVYTFSLSYDSLRESIVFPQSDDTLVQWLLSKNCHTSGRIEQNKHWRRVFSDTILRSESFASVLTECCSLQGKSLKHSIETSARFPISKLVSENSLLRLCRSQLRSNHSEINTALVLQPRLLFK